MLRIKQIHRNKKQQTRCSKTERMMEKLGVSHVNHLKDLYSKFIKNSKSMNEFLCHLMSDLLRVDGYSDVEISYASGVSLEVIRKLLADRINHIDRESFLLLIGLYARVFC